MSNEAAANISSLDALRDRKLRLELEERAARRGLSDTLANTPQAAKEYAVEDLALPAMGIGLAAYIAYRVLRSKKQEPSERIVYVQAARNPEEGSSAPEPQLNISHTVHPPRPRPAQQPVAQSARISKPAAPAPAPAPAPPPVRQQQTSSFQWGKLLAAGKILVPAVQAITTVVMNQRTHDEVKETQKDVQKTQTEVEQTQATVAAKSGNEMVR